jgi:hypothetical protein
MLFPGGTRQDTGWPPELLAFRTERAQDFGLAAREIGCS